MKKQVIGITGGIGCGKSAVMNLLEQEYGARVLLADTVGHELMKPGGANYKGITEYFGTEILQENGEIDRKKLGERVFSCDAELAVLNQITHHNIIKEVKQRIQTGMEDDKVPFVCLESAILLTTDLARLCDQIWYIHAREDVRIERLIAGRGYTAEYCRSVMKKQEEENFYLKYAQVVIDNSGSVEETRQQLSEALGTIPGNSIPESPHPDRIPAHDRP